MRKIFNYFFDVYYLFKLDLGGNTIVNNLELADGYSTLLINSIDNAFFNSLVSLWEKAYTKKRINAIGEVTSTLLRGDVCIAAIYQGELVGMCWSGEHAAINDLPFASLLKNEKSVGIGHNHYVDPEHSGKKLQRILTIETLIYAHNKGLKAYYVFVGVKNIVSTINLVKIFPELKLVYHLKIDIPFFVFNFYPGLTREKWSKR